MRLNNNKIFILVLLVALIVLFISGISSSTIVGSSHDLSKDSHGGKFYSTNEDEVCIFCHTPHNAIIDDVGDGSGNRVPLWNRNFGPSSDPNRDKTGFSLYSSATLNATAFSLDQPKGYTLLCLSCHDGITAINAVVQHNRNNPITMYDFDQLGDAWNPSFPDHYPGMNIGGATPNTYSDPYYGTVNSNTKDLSDDHPVSFVFDSSLVLQDPKLKLPDASSKLKLFNGRLECPTCHNPHEEGGGYAKGTDEYEINMPFLRVTKDKSQICTDCHIK